MVDERRYDLLLDLYPVLSTFPLEANLLLFRIEREGLRYLRREDNELLLFLRLAKDLGYIDNRLFVFLEGRVSSSRTR